MKELPDLLVYVSQGHVPPEAVSWSAAFRCVFRCVCTMPRMKDISTGLREATRAPHKKGL